MHDVFDAFRRWLAQRTPPEPDAFAPEAPAAADFGSKLVLTDLLTNTHDDVLRALEMATGLRVQDCAAWGPDECERVATWFAVQASSPVDDNTPPGRPDLDEEADRQGTC
jgi:hypothetical protein